MADLRDRYRRDYRSVPIPTPPRQNSQRGNFTGAPPLPGASSPEPAPLTPPVEAPTPVTPPTPGPQPPMTPPSTHLAPAHKPAHLAPTKPQEAPQPAIHSQAQAVPKKAVERPKKAHKAKKRKRSRRVLKFILIPLLIILILAGLTVGASYAWYSYQMKAPLPIDASYVNSADFPVYLPDKLPSGYAIDKSTLNNQDNALVFTIKNSDETYKEVAVSEQKRPAQLSDNEQIPGHTPGADDRSFDTPIGKAQFGDHQGNIVGSIATPKTWIIMNISTTPLDDAEAIAKSFQPLRPSSPWEPLQDFRAKVTDKLKSIF